MTRNTTSYREKGRAVVLAALMVLSVVAMSAAFVGTTAAQVDNSIDEGDNFWEGTQVEFGQIDGTAIDGDTVDVSEIDGDRGVELSVTNDTATLDTTSSFLGPGDYEVSDGTNTVEIEIKGQSIIVDADESVNQGSSATVNVESDRAGYNAYVTAEGIDSETLADFIDEGSYDSEEDAVELTNLGNNYEFSIDTTESLSTGEYNITVGAVDTVAEDTFTLQVNDKDAQTVSFEENLVRSTPGDHGVVQVDLQNTDTGYLEITWDDEYTVLEGTVEGDEVGSTVSIELNTHHLVGDDQSQSTIVGDVENGDFTVDSTGDNLGYDVWDFTNQFDMATYTDEAMENRADRGTFRLTDRSTDAVNVYASSTNDVETWEDNMMSADEIAEDDYVVVEVEADGIYGYFDDLESQGVELSITHTNPGYGDEPITFDTSDMVPQEDEDRFLVFIEASEDGINAGDWTIGEGDAHFDVTFSVTAEADAEEGDAYNYYTDESEEVSTEFTVTEREFGFDSDTYNVDAAEGVEITGTTNAAPGSTVEVAADGHADNPFWKDATAETQSDGTWAAEFDFSGEPEGAAFDLDATEVSSGLEDTAAGTVGDAPEGADFRVSASVPDQVEVDGDASLDVTVTNAGKQAGEDTLTVTIDGEEYTEDISLDAGEATDQFSWDIDTSSEGEVDWSAETSDTSDSGTLTVGDDPGSDGGDGDDGDDDGGDGDDGDDDDGEGSPGFGVAVALVALLSAAMLALRRQN